MSNKKSVDENIREDLLFQLSRELLRSPHLLRVSSMLNSFFRQHFKEVEIHFLINDKINSRASLIDSNGKLTDLSNKEFQNKAPFLGKEFSQFSARNTPGLHQILPDIFHSRRIFNNMKSDIYLLTNQECIIDDSENSIELLEGFGELALFSLEGGICFNDRLINEKVEIMNSSKNDFEEVNQNLRQAILSRNNFFAKMSHELRTPLNVILGLVENILENDLDSKILEKMRLIADSGNSLLEIINNILDINKLEENDFQLRNESFNLNSLIYDSVMSLKNEAELRNLDVVLEIDERLHKYFYGDRYRVRQIIINLAWNAIKFTREGFVKIKVFNGTNSRIHFQIIDTGIGIRKEDRDKVFKAYHQKEESLDRKYEGTGLGLAICSQLIHLMNGKIWITDNELEGKGSIFNFFIELEEASESDFKASLEAKFESQISIENIFEKNLNILYIEDDLLNQKLIQFMFQDSNFTLTIKDNGKDGVEAFKKDKFDIVMMDMQMPVMSGAEATEIIRRYEIENNLLRTPIITLSANISDSDRKLMEMKGADFYLAKPVKKKELAKTILKSTQMSDFLKQS